MTNRLRDKAKYQRLIRLTQFHMECWEKALKKERVAWKRYKDSEKRKEAFRKICERRYT